MPLGRGDGGKRLQKALVVSNHGGDLRLLQHDLADPDAVQIASPPPRKIASVIRSMITAAALAKPMLLRVE